MRISSGSLSEKDKSFFKLLKDNNESTRLGKQLQESQYLDIVCKTSSGFNIGSMFIVVREEDEENCEYKIINESKSVDLLYYQHIDKAKIPQRLTGIDESKY